MKSTPSLVHLSLGVCAFALVAIFAWPGSAADGSKASVGLTDNAQSLNSAIKFQPLALVTEAPPANAIAINDVDPITSEPIERDSPTTYYKGRIVAFCCENSPSANGGWERMSETEKDAFVARFVK